MNSRRRMSHPEPVVPNRISAFGLLAFAALQIARDAYGEFGVRLVSLWPSTTLLLNPQLLPDQRKGVHGAKVPEADIRAPFISGQERCCTDRAAAHPKSGLGLTKQALQDRRKGFSFIERSLSLSSGSVPPELKRQLARCGHRAVAQLVQLLPGGIGMPDRRG